ncbi:unnamed protein product [Urochloa humidicola]
MANIASMVASGLVVVPKKGDMCHNKAIQPGFYKVHLDSIQPNCEAVELPVALGDGGTTLGVAIGSWIVWHKKYIILVDSPPQHLPPIPETYAAEPSQPHPPPPEPTKSHMAAITSMPTEPPPSKRLRTVDPNMSELAQSWHQQLLR